MHSAVVVVTTSSHHLTPLRFSRAGCFPRRPPCCASRCFTLGPPFGLGLGLLRHSVISHERVRVLIGRSLRERVLPVLPRELLERGEVCCTSRQAALARVPRRIERERAKERQSNRKEWRVSECEEGEGVRRNEKECEGMKRKGKEGKHAWALSISLTYRVIAPRAILAWTAGPGNLIVRTRTPLPSIASSEPCTDLKYSCDATFTSTSPAWRSCERVRLRSGCGVRACVRACVRGSV